MFARTERQRQPGVVVVVGKHTSASGVVDWESSAWPAAPDGR